MWGFMGEDHRGSMRKERELWAPERGGYNPPLHHHHADGIFRGKGSAEPCARCILEHAAPDLAAACLYTLNNLDAAAKDGLITAPAWFQVQLGESRKLLLAAINKAKRG